MGDAEGLGVEGGAGLPADEVLYELFQLLAPYGAGGAGALPAAADLTDDAALDLPAPALPFATDGSSVWPGGSSGARSPGVGFGGGGFGDGGGAPSGSEGGPWGGGSDGGGTPTGSSSGTDLAGSIVSNFNPLYGAIISLFGPAAAPPVTFDKYVMPERENFIGGLDAGDLVGPGGFDQYGNPRLDSPAPSSPSFGESSAAPSAAPSSVGLAAASPEAAASPAFDADFFMEHSAAIAAAVRSEMLYSAPINDVVSAL
jgi:hypothetical protein